VRELLKTADERILVLDGATGTALQSLNLTAQDFGGAELEGCNENLVFTRPDVVEQVSRIYLEAGCDIVETNTFGATELVLDEYGLGAKAYEANRLASEIARRVCAEFDCPERMHFVAGSMGPTTKALSLTGGISFEALSQHYFEQARGLFDGGADYLLLETCNDGRNIKAALVAFDRLFTETEKSGRGRIPVAVSATIENSGTMLAGQSIEALVAALMNRDLFYLGLNCATGPEFMTDHVRSLAELSPFRVACVPNAGLPDEDGQYLETPEMVGKAIEHFLKAGWLNFVGGCCGTNADHIRKLTEIAKGVQPRAPKRESRSILSGVDFLEITDELRPVIVGERTNVIGSRKFKEMITAEQYDEAAEIAKHQVKAGAHIIDVCLANPDRDELTDVENFLEFVVKKIRVPLMIDSTDTKVIARALTFCQGKAIINSINLEDGEERFDEIVPLARQFGAALVVGTIDEDPDQGMGVTRERKLAIAERSHQLLTEKYGFPEEDIYFDPLVFPCGTGDEQYRTSAPETIEGLRLIKQRFPRVKTALGISNVSFGLPAAGREVLNSVFLYHCVQAGLDLAIVNSEKLERFGSLPKEEIELAENLLFSRDEDPLGKFAAKFRDRKTAAKKERSLTPLDERLSNSVVEGTKDGLIEDLGEAMKARKPLEIINGPLMAGMDEVGRLFNANKLIVAEVLQSAEVMKAAVGFLEPHMEKADVSSRGKVLLATVKGDVHDIGKNLVDIILSNNGYNVVNLGIKIPPEQLINACREHKPDIIGLSGLLVKSAHQMVSTAEDLARAGVTTPILVGGAALSRNFTEKRIFPAYNDGAVIYARDAMSGLDLANKITDSNKTNFVQLMSEITERRRAADAAEAAAPAKSAGSEPAAPNDSRSHAVRVLQIEQIPQPPDFRRHIQNNVSVEGIWKFINPLMLYNRHLGIKPKIAKQFELMAKDPTLARKIKEEDPSAYGVWEKVEEVKAQYNDTPYLQPSSIYRFFRAAGQGNSLFLYCNPTDHKPGASLKFDRQTKGERLCLTDYVAPVGGPSDNIALFLTTCGKGVRDESARLRAKGEFLKSHILQAVAIETAEAYAEYLHSFLRAAWGFADDLNMTMMERFQARYRGKRFSFGYPACPRLEDQALLFELLHPADIGVQLTEGFMMDPEASVSAIVFHHPDAKYFGIGSTTDGNGNDTSDGGTES
jgi:5-methyltetrahydrofolate--homocysteine methyltransferase